MKMDGRMKKKTKTKKAKFEDRKAKKELRNIILIAFAFSGMAALIYEVVWTRPLSLIFLN